MTTIVPVVDHFVPDDDAPHLLARVCDGCGAQYLERRNGCGRCGGRQFLAAAGAAVGIGDTERRVDAVVQIISTDSYVATDPVNAVLAANCGHRTGVARAAHDDGRRQSRGPTR